jgi:hypothetical protein
MNYQQPTKPIAIAQRTAMSMIWVTFDKVGFHHYPGAPVEVAYLRHPHRHVFKFRVSISVFHDDREIEFHMFKRWLTSLYDTGELNVDHKSCEMLAQDLEQAIQKKYNCVKRYITVEISEDGECGATLMTQPGPMVVTDRDELLEILRKEEQKELDRAA